MGLLKGDGSAATSAGSATGGFNAILDRGSEFEGKLAFEGTVRIDGKFKGEIHSDATLVVGESGRVEADIEIGTISVSGEVVGNVKAKNRIELHSPAIVKGNLETPVLVIEEGVTYEGNCMMQRSGAPSRPGKARFEGAAKTETKPGEKPGEVHP